MVVVVVKLKTVNVIETGRVNVTIQQQPLLLSPWGEGMAQSDTMYRNMEVEAVEVTIILVLLLHLADKLED